MKIVWMTWKDLRHPQSGGAELVNEELAKKLVSEGHEVKFLVGGWKGCIKSDERYGYQIIRLGNRYTVYLQAYFYYKKNLKDWADLVIDECNTVPFFSKFYAKCKTVFIIQQLAKEVWFYQLPLPFSLIGFLLEPIYLRFFNDQKTFTFAESTKKDLIKLGFSKDNIVIISEGYTIKPVPNINQVSKPSQPTILYFSALREMKRPDHVIKAFEIAKASIKNLRLIVAGDGLGSYATGIKKMIINSPHSRDIKYLGAIKDEKIKCEIMQSAHYICCTSVREGWGIIVSEAGSQGTPAVVYDIHGLRDAVGYGSAGVIAKENTPNGMAKEIIFLFENHASYEQLQIQAYKMACNVNVNTTFKTFHNF
jgi:glycosyltransferase involved in cell wall biosynthesis